MIQIDRNIVDPMIQMNLFYRQAERYYEGEIYEMWTSDALRRLMNLHHNHNTDHVSLNYLRPVIDSVNNRLKINNISAETARARKLIEEVRYDNDMHLEEQEVHRRALIYGESFAMVWPDEDGDWCISYHTPKDTIVIYDPENPRKKIAGARIWHDTINGGQRLNLITKDKVYKYSTPTEELSMGSVWSLIEEAENPFGEVPIFHFRTNKPYGRPEHRDGYSIQDAINKLAQTHLVTVDFQGAPQRWALEDTGDGSELEDFQEDMSLDYTPESSPKAHPGALQSHPGELWLLKNVKSVGQFTPANPAVFWDPIRDNITALASLTNTPLHYFIKTSHVPTGNALRAAEAPLLKKIGERQASFGATWRELWEFIVEAEFGKEETVLILWDTVESIDVLDIWDVMAKKSNVGMPFRQIMKEAGYDQNTIDEMVKQKAAQAQEMGDLYNRNPQIDNTPVDQTGKATNTNPEVRTNVNKDETKINTGKGQ